MLRKLLIIFAGLGIALAAGAEATQPLRISPEPKSKIIGAIKNTETMIFLERQGEWAKVVDVETGMVGWLASPEMGVIARPNGPKQSMEAGS
jgi:hypothetical protein